jgi:hypothetical protein
MTNEDRIRQSRAEKQALEKLIENPEFVRFMGEIESAYMEAESAHEDPAKTPGERAEWLYAMKKLRVLKDRPTDRLKTLKSNLASLGAVE